jgi:hypothetical protein
MRNRDLVFGCSILAVGLAISTGQKPAHPVSGSPRPTSSGATTTPNSQVGMNSYPFDVTTIEDPEVARRRRLEEMFGAERQRQNMADSARLVALARQLNAEYEKPVPPEMSDSQFNTVKEIEKLAKRVKRRLEER